MDHLALYHRRPAMLLSFDLSFFFFFNDTATTEIYTLSLHDALPIFPREGSLLPGTYNESRGVTREQVIQRMRSEEHTSELQSRQYLVCRLLLEKKKNIERLCG